MPPLKERTAETIWPYTAVNGSTGPNTPQNMISNMAPKRHHQNQKPHKKCCPLAWHCQKKDQTDMLRATDSGTGTRCMVGSNVCQSFTSSQVNELAFQRDMELLLLNCASEIILSELGAVPAGMCSTLVNTVIHRRLGIPNTKTASISECVCQAVWIRLRNGSPH